MNSKPPISQSTARASAQPAADASTSVHCKNCGLIVSDQFCGNCGQASNVHVPSTAELVHELMEGLTHFDSRLWRTLEMLWFSPGSLTKEFVAGRRMAYLPPFRLYLVVSVVFFFLASLSPMRGQVITFDAPRTAPPTDLTSCRDVQFEGLNAYPELSRRVQHACVQIVGDNGANLMHIALNTMYKAMFFFLPLIAALNMLMYWRPRYPYAEQLVFFVHLHATYFSAALLLLIAVDAAHAPRLQGIALMMQTLLGWAMAVYTVTAVRRVFAKSWAGALLKTAALFFIYAAAFALMVAIVFAFALLQL